MKRHVDQYNVKSLKISASDIMKPDKTKSTQRGSCSGVNMWGKLGERLRHPHENVVVHTTRLWVTPRSDTTKLGQDIANVQIKARCATQEVHNHTGGSKEWRRLKTQYRAKEKHLCCRTRTRLEQMRRTVFGVSHRHLTVIADVRLHCPDPTQTDRFHTYCTHPGFIEANAPYRLDETASCKKKKNACDFPPIRCRVDGPKLQRYMQTSWTHREKFVHKFRKKWLDCHRLTRDSALVKQLG